MNSYSVQLQQEKWHKSQEQTNQYQRWSDVSLLKTGLHSGSVGCTSLTNVTEHLGADRAHSCRAPIPRHLTIQNAFTLTSTGAHHPKTEPTGAATDLSPAPSVPVLCMPVVSKWHTWKGMTPSSWAKCITVWDSVRVWVHGTKGILSQVYGRTMFSVSLRLRTKDPYPGSWEPRNTFLSFGSDTRLSL